MKISQERWQQAQEAEIDLHDHGPDIRNNYSLVYNQYLKMPQWSVSLAQLSSQKILEIGPAFYPAVSYFQIKERHVVEPLFAEFPDEIKKEYEDYNIKVHSLPMEETKFKESEFDEVWCFNVLQHVIDPGEVLQKSFRAGKVLRFFEPIDYPIEPSHPHAFDLGWFEQQFPDHKIHLFTGGTIPHFHTANCAFAEIRKH